MRPIYVQAIDRLRWLTGAVESRLERMPDGEAVEVDNVPACGARRRPTVDEELVAIDALVGLGVLTGSPGRYVVIPMTLVHTMGYRTGVREGAQARSADDGSVRLCMTLPPDLASSVEAAFREVTEDLRGAVVDLTVGSKRGLVLIRPFWDVTTLHESGPILLRRLAAGVSVQLLGRFDLQTPSVARGVLRSRQTHDGCRVLSWYELSSSAPFGSPTFHLKAAVADGGTRGYLGTATFTTSGLRSGARHPNEGTSRSPASGRDKRDPLAHLVT